MKFIFDILLLLIYSLSVLFVYKYGANEVVYLIVYLFLLRILKAIFYFFSVSDEFDLSKKLIANILIWTVIFIGFSLPYFLLEGINRLFFLNFYFVFMSLIGLSGFTILIYNLNVLEAVKLTFKTMKPKVFSWNFCLSLLILNLVYSFDFQINLYYLMPFLLYFVTKKFLRDFHIKVDNNIISDLK